MPVTIVRYNRCHYDAFEADRHGYHHIGCIHPERYKLSGKFSRFFHKLFGVNYRCDAKPGFEEYCPYFRTTSVSLKEMVEKL